MHAPHFRVLPKKGCYRTGIPAMPLHTQMQRLGAAQNQKAIQGGRDCTRGLYLKPEAFGPRVVVRQNSAANHIGVAPKVLGRGMQGQICPESQRLLKKRRCKRIVHRYIDSRSMSYFGYGRNIHHPQQRVRWGLDP